MGRTRTKKRLNPRAKASSAEKSLITPSSSSTTAKIPTVSDLLDKAQSLIVQCDYELALRFVRRILEQEPGSASAREMLGICLLETGDTEGAREAFQSLIKPPPAPAPPPSAHLYLAQLAVDEPLLALKHYQTAVEILMNQLKGKQGINRINTTIDADEKGTEIEIKNNIVRALVGQVEIWMDPTYDLCFEPEAEKTCEDLLSLALQVDPDNSEALQALASVRMSQQRPEDAKACLEKSWKKWKELDLDDPTLPPLPTRLSLVKLFLEVASYQAALLVLQGIIATDDQDVEAWYLEGWCFFLMAEQAKEGGKIQSSSVINGVAGADDVDPDLSWEDLARNARDCLETCKILHTKQDHPDKPILEHVQELITQLDLLGIKPSPLDEENDEGDDDEEWEDVSGDETDGDGDVEMQ